MATRTRKVAVIGAGSGGVNVAKHLLEAGHDVTVFEAGSYVGGMWKYENDNGRSQAYLHLCIITPRGKTEFPDFPFDEQTPRFPSHWDMYRYLKAYSDHFGVTERVRFRTPVSKVEPAFDPRRGEEPRWDVHHSEGRDTFDDVVIATGHLNEPNHSAFLRDSFAGEYMHSNEFRTARPFVGKRVCVVGTGNSGVDIASEACSVAERTVLVARSGVRIQPKVVLGLAYPDIAIGLRRPGVPAWFTKRVLSTLVYLAHGNQERLGFTPPVGRQHPTSSESVVSHIEFGRVVVRPGIKSISGKTIMFEDGSEEEFDVLVAATGYRVHLPFIDPSVIPVKGNHVELYKRIFPVDWPGLYFLGMLNPLLAYSQVFEAQSRTIVQAVNGEIVLPSREEMLAEIRRNQELAASEYTDSPRHELEEPDTNYPHTMAAFRRESAIRARHRGRLPKFLRQPMVQRLYAKVAGIEHTAA
jgi:cation diffusion facilitator CzcD-associated flavoprotein CzcO